MMGSAHSGTMKGKAVCVVIGALLDAEEDKATVGQPCAWLKCWFISISGLSSGEKST